MSASTAAVMEAPVEQRDAFGETPVETILREYIVLRDVSQEPKSPQGKSFVMTWRMLNRYDRHHAKLIDQNDTVVVVLRWTVQAPPSGNLVALYGSEWPEAVREKPYWKSSVYRGRKALRFTDDDWVAAARQHGKLFPEGAKEE